MQISDEEANELYDDQVFHLIEACKDVGGLAALARRLNELAEFIDTQRHTLDSLVDIDDLPSWGIYKTIPDLPLLPTRHPFSWDDGCAMFRSIDGGFYLVKWTDIKDVFKLTES